MFVVKASLANKALREAASVWRTYHPMVERKILQGVADTIPYAVLWLNLKRVVLKEFGFVVVAAPSTRIYFEEPNRSFASASVGARPSKGRQVARARPYLVAVRRGRRRR